jgi:hypothetical protein
MQNLKTYYAVCGDHPHVIEKGICLICKLTADEIERAEAYLSSEKEKPNERERA